MKNNIIENYKKSLEAIYEHVGFTEDWVVYPIDDCTKSVWSCNGTEVRYADSMKQFNSDGDYYENEVYTQRFYKKWVYEGEIYTMIFCNPQVDGMKWFRIFSNEKRQS